MNYLFIRAIRSRCSFGKDIDFHPGNSQILFSDNFPVSFAAENVAVMGDVIIGSLKAFLKAAKNNNRYSRTDSTRRLTEI